ncbi:MAG: zinc-dependent metalloprotease [Phycisphaerae bacterium]|nr:zinc-dependent metalloprotease [Phycisphaerae bacterium]
MKTYRNTYTFLTFFVMSNLLCLRKNICYAALTLLLLFCGVVSAEPQGPAPQARAPVSISNDVRLPAGAALRFESDTYEQLRGRRRVRLTGFPLTKQETVDLELEQFEVTTPATIIVEGTAEGDKPLPHPEVMLFKGRVAGEDNSEAVIGISPYGNNGYIRKGNLLYYLAPDRKAGKGGRTDIHTIAERSEITTGNLLEDFSCRARPNPELVSADTDIFDCMWETGPFPSSYEWRVAFVAVDCDYAYYQQFGGDFGAALAYAIQLAGTSSHFFERDMNIKWYLSYIRIWTSPDPYVLGEDVFNAFAFYWQLNMDHVDRDLAMLFSCRPSRWGVSLCPTLCDNDWGFTINFGLQGWFPRPVRDLDSNNWDLHVVPHEAGHTFGSHHTHCYKPAIDNCALEDADAENQWCQDRTDFNDCVPGTLMSYCGGDNCGGYANELMSFHPRVVNCIREYVDDITNCLRHGMNPVYADWTNTGFEDGTTGNPFNTVAEAVQVVIPDGTVYIASGSYHEGFIANRPVTLLATGGTVYIGP